MLKTIKHQSGWLLTAIVCLAVFTSTALAASDRKCSSSSTFYCPNCGGIQVEDCLDCVGYLSSDVQHDICIDRKLFQPHNSDPSDPANHYHYLWNDLVAMVVWFFTAGVATACGVGGGGIYVPLGILLLRLAPKQASGLSQASIFGASLGGLFLNSRDCHPNAKIRNQVTAPVTTNHDTSNVDNHVSNRNVQEPNKTAEEEYLREGGKFYTRPLINYDMALFLAPMEMAGAVLGLLVQKILPNWLYLLIAGVVLCFTSYKTYKKFFAVRKKEKEPLEKIKQQQQEAEVRATAEEEASGEEVLVAVEEGTCSSSSPADEETTTPEDEDSPNNHIVLKNNMNATEVPPTPGNADAEAQLNHGNGVHDDNSHKQDTDEEEEATTRLRTHYLERDMRQYPGEKIAALVVLFSGLTLLTLMKGGKGVESIVGITCQSPWYGVLIALQFLWLFVFAAYFGVQLVKKQTKRQAVHYPYLTDDPVWDRKSLRFYGFFTFVAGIVAGLIGIGGGMVLGPLMLVMGIHPRVSTATTATLVVLTSSSVAIIAVTSGLVPWSYAVFYFAVCLCGAVVGKLKIDGYVKKTGRASILIFILASIILLATVGVLVILLTRLAAQDWCLDGFNQFCVVDSDEACAANRMLEAAASQMGEWTAAPAVSFWRRTTTT